MAIQFKGPGEWHSQAEYAGVPENIFAQLAEHHRLLSDKGESEAASHVAAASQLLRDGEVDEAAERLHEAGSHLSPKSAAHAQGLRHLAAELPPL